MDFPAVTEGRNARGTLTAEALLTKVTLRHGLVMSSGESAQMSLIYTGIQSQDQGWGFNPSGQSLVPKHCPLHIGLYKSHLL